MTAAAPRTEVGEDSPVWADAVMAAALFAVDPSGLGGVALRARAGPVRETWLDTMRAILPESAPMRRVPLHIADNRLLGGLDLAATLRAGRPVAASGVLANADGGVAVLAMAERIEPATIARIAAVMDAGEVVVAREGIERRSATRFGVIALDEGASDDERAPPALLDRLAFHLDLTEIAPRQAAPAPVTPADIAAARAGLADVVVAEDFVQALCAASLALGIASGRASLLALRAARASAALAGRREATEEDAQAAARLVLAPRATQLPAPPEEAESEPPPDDAQEEPPEPEEAPPPPEQEPDGSDAERKPDPGEREMDEMVLEAARAAIPAGLLLRLQSQAAMRGGARSAGKAGALRKALRRGRPAGVRRGDPRTGARLSVIDTLRAAAPWQGLRRRDADRPESAKRLEVRADDFHITRYKQRSETTTIFVVDASGSSALNRLAEAKGAVELLLAECYIRRDQVAVIAFRGRGAELLLPPTRSLVRAKRSLAALPGGGGTPLAAGIEAAAALADAVRRRGGTPAVVLLTDGRANVTREGTGGRPIAEQQASEAAGLLRRAHVSAVLVDTSPRPYPFAQRLAAEMHARYLPLPYADATSLSRAARAMAAEGAREGR